VIFCRPEDEVAVAGDRQQRCGRDVAGPAGSSGSGGVESDEDPGDRRGQGETDKVDARMLAQLLAADLLPPYRIPARVYVTKRGRRVGALVPVDVAERSEEDEDAYWSARATNVMEAGEPTVPWDEAVRMLETGTVDE
jgi:hypothetical protein